MTEWQGISTAPSRQTILIAFKNSLGNWRIVKAMHAPRLTVEQDAWSNTDFCEYDEGRDAFFWPEGWYEDVHAETGLDYSYHYLGEDPTHWMPLPPSPTKGE